VVAEELEVEVGAVGEEEAGAVGAVEVGTGAVVVMLPLVGATRLQRLWAAASFLRHWQAAAGGRPPSPSAAAAAAGATRTREGQLPMALLLLLLLLQ
jgi:hypothetical protein